MKMHKWKTAKLGGVCGVFAGQGAPQGAHNYSANGTPFIKAGDMLDLVQGADEASIQKVTDAVAKSYRLKLFPSGTVLFAKSGMSATKGHIYSLLSPAYVVSHLACLVPKDQRCYSGYLGYFFRKYSPATLIKDSGYPSISLNDISKVFIPLPPLDEQKRIADILDKAAELISLRKQQIEKLDLLLKSKFIDMFGDPVTNPKGWETKTLGIVGSFKNGINYAQKDRGQTVLCIGVGDFKGTGILTDCSKLSSVNLQDYPDSSLFLKDGDIVFVRSNGSKHLVGRSILFHAPDTTRVTFSGFCIRLRLTISNLNAMFVYAALNSELYRNRMMSGGRGCNIKNLNQQMLSAMPVIVPPLKLQNEFAAFVEAVEKQKAQMKSGLEKLERNYQALMAECF